MSAGEGEEEQPSTRLSGKSASAFRTISEVSLELDVPQHVLRFWETKFSQIKPLKRGGGRRYYRPDDVELLRKIQTLLYRQGYTIKGAQRLIKEPGALDATLRGTDAAARPTFGSETNALSVAPALSVAIVGIDPPSDGHQQEDFFLQASEVAATQEAAGIADVLVQAGEGKHRQGSDAAVSASDGSLRAAMAAALIDLLAARRLLD
jgi:DNA-binding transcriptional MerR regulator